MNPSLEEIVTKILERIALVQDITISVSVDHQGAVNYLVVVGYRGTRFNSCAAKTVYEAILACYLAMEAKSS